jgi:hypothetical protein
LIAAVTLWRILTQLADDPIEHLGVLMEAPSDR